MHDPLNVKRHCSKFVFVKSSVKAAFDDPGGRAV